MEFLFLSWSSHKRKLSIGQSSLMPIFWCYHGVVMIRYDVLFVNNGVLRMGDSLQCVIGSKIMQQQAVQNGIGNLMIIWTIFGATTIKSASIVSRALLCRCVRILPTAMRISLSQDSIMRRLCRMVKSAFPLWSIAMSILARSP